MCTAPKHTLENWQNSIHRINMKTLEQKIMSRVRRIYYLRKLMGPTAIKAYALVALTLALVSLVSVVNVVTNMPSVTAPLSMVRFFTSAVLKTEAAVQVLLVGLCLLAVLMARDIVRTTKSTRGVLMRA